MRATERQGRNEGKARQGIDTTATSLPLILIVTCRNEGKARQGIDTPNSFILSPIFREGRNEGKARQGIDTKIFTLKSFLVGCVEMRVKPDRALTQQIIRTDECLQTL